MSNEMTVLMFFFAGAAVAMLVTAVRLSGARRRRAQAILRRIEAETAQERERQEEKRRQDAAGYHTSPIGEPYMGLSAALRETNGFASYKAGPNGGAPLSRAHMQSHPTREELERRAAGQKNTRSDDLSVYANVTYLMAVNAAAPLVEREVGKSPALSMGYGSDFSTGGGFGSDTSFSTGSDSSCSSDSGSSSCSSD